MMGTPRLRTIEHSAIEMRRKADDGVIETQILIEDRKIPKSSLPKEMAADPLLLPREIAESMKVDPKTVTRWINKGKYGEAPNVIRIPGGHWRIRSSAHAEAIRVATELAGD